MRFSGFSLSKAAAALTGMVSLSAILGVLLTAGVTPVIAVTGMAANNAIGIFENLPGYIKPDALSQKSNIFAKNPDGSPLFLASVFEQDRVMVGWDAVSQYAKDALVATEDPRFYTHGGVDIQSSVRALVQNTAAGDTVSGASTISMQYVKNILVQRVENIANPAERELAYTQAIKTSTDRKLKEMKLAIGLEKEYSKDDILLGYMNIALFGGRVYGIEAAANYYFGVSARDLTLPQAASLVGTVQNPERFRIDRAENIPAHTERRNYVLDRMLIEGRLSPPQHDEAVATPVTPNIVRPSTGCQTAQIGAGFFCDYVLDVITHDPAFGPDPDTRERNLRTGGFTIYTTLDPDLQQTALALMNERVPRAMDSVNIGSAMTSVEAGTGRVLMMVLNKDYNSDPEAASPENTAVNYATDYEYGGSTGFPVGSTYKVFVLTEWLKKGHGLGDSVSGDARAFPMSAFTCHGDGLGGGSYAPKNDSGQKPGSMTVASALAGSVNAAFITMSQKLDLCDIRDTAITMGVHRADGRELGSNPSDSLGTNEIAPLTMAAAFATFSAKGLFCQPIAIDAIVDAAGNPVPVPSANCTQVLDPNIAAGTAQAMKGVLGGGGTGGRSNPNNGYQHIGKTGTTDGEKHTWFVGGSTRVSTAVWVGNVEGSASMARVRINGFDGNVVRHELFRPYMDHTDDRYPPDVFPAPFGSVLAGTSIPVPNVLGMSVGEAERTIRNAGLEFVDGGEVDRPEAPGRVVASSPEPGGSTGIGGTVTVFTSNQSVAGVPDVTGMSVEQAKATLSAQGWLVGAVLTEKTSGNCDPSVVRRSDPWASYAAKPGETTVNLVVCSKS